MRVAASVIALCATLILGAKSGLAILDAGGRAVFGEPNDYRTDAAGRASVGMLGLFVAALWLLAAVGVLSKPNIAMWMFGAAGAICLAGAATGVSDLTGNSDLTIATGASFLFAAMSWYGIRERAAEETDPELAAAERERWLAAVEAKAKATPPE